MNTVVPERPAPPNIKAALCMIGDWANRDKLSPAQIIEIFTDGFVLHHQQGLLLPGQCKPVELAPALANTAQPATENVAFQGATNA